MSTSIKAKLKSSDQKFCIYLSKNYLNTYTLRLYHRIALILTSCLIITDSQTDVWTIMLKGQINRWTNELTPI